MTYIGAGTYVMKKAAVTTQAITIDGEDYQLLDNGYHLVVVKEYGSYDSTKYTTIKVPNGTISISFP